MTAKNHRSPAAREAVVAAPVTLEVLTELGRQQLAIVADGASAVFRGSETMRRIQQQAAHRACAHCETAAQKLRHPGEAGQLANPWELLHLDLQEVSGYWQQMTETALKTQGEVMGLTSQMLSLGASDGLKPALQAWQTAITAPAAQVPAALKPILDTWQSAVAGKLNGPESRAAH